MHDIDIDLRMAKLVVRLYWARNVVAHSPIRALHRESKLAALAKHYDQLVTRVWEAPVDILPDSRDQMERLTRLAQRQVIVEDAEGKWEKVPQLKISKRTFQGASGPESGETQAAGPPLPEASETIPRSDWKAKPSQPTGSPKRASSEAAEGESPTKKKRGAKDSSHDFHKKLGQSLGRLQKEHPEALDRVQEQLLRVVEDAIRAAPR